MSFVVPFDGSKLSEAALVQARITEIGYQNLPPDILDKARPMGPPDVTAVSVIPERASYARDKGWIAEDEAFEPRTVIERLHEHVTELAPNAQFEYLRTDSTAAGTIGLKLRNKARQLNATTVFLGSENAGRIVSPVMSVGSRVSAEQDYNVVLVKRELPPEIQPRVKPDFYFPN
jgi:hypothetical protein